MKKSVILILVLVVVVLIVGVSLFFGFQVNLEKARDIALDRVSDENAEIIEEKSEKNSCYRSMSLRFLQMMLAMKLP
ncbi:hypothetical protein [Faecalicoccus pleomorphus]|uniref:hypothetical protein n=1 Tax=Faecalicoccus pleomorphus TaxID=1323 RepID=UPI0024322EEA|nr:hypothetical protein [Faecalicoccus pleomorphus]